MLLFALKMLIGDRAKYFGLILGLSFASLIITQQTATFVGIMMRTYGFISDTTQPSIWVMDPKVQYVDDIKPLKSTDTLRVKGVDGVGWAVPLYKGLLRARLANGSFQSCIVIGVDDATLIGAPPQMLQGNILSLREPDAIIVDYVGATTKLAKEIPNKPSLPLQIGEEMEINDNRSVVTGICKVTRTFQSQPVIYTTYGRATTFAPRERKFLSFILAHEKPGEDPKIVCQRIKAQTGLAAYTKEEFIKLTLNYFLKKTAIPINFGITVLLGFILGTAIAGQTFYNFALDNLRYFGTFKAMGANNYLLIKMITLQGLWVGFIGWAIGAGAASLLGFLSRYTELSFNIPISLFFISALSMLLIALFAAVISLLKIMKLDISIIFKS
jgi:putative ABC transport system permease protein